MNATKCNKQRNDDVFLQFKIGGFLNVQGQEVTHFPAEILTQ